MHKLIPSVIDDMQIKEKIFSEEAVTYSGPTYVGIRSAKHTWSNAYHHLQDMKLSCPWKSFKEVCRMVTVDGGPDENPRYKKTIECAIDYFT